MSDAAGTPEGRVGAWELLPLLEQLHRYLRCIAQQMPREWVEDQLEELVLCLLETRAIGGAVQDLAAFSRAFLRRRLVDEVRRQRRRPRGFSDLEQLASLAAASTDWVAVLRREGYEPTGNWARILDRIASGTRSSKGLARALGRDVTSVRESRRRLQRWLRRVLQALAPPPERLGSRNGRGACSLTNGGPECVFDLASASSFLCSCQPG